jgi:hypothetical protein
MEQAGSGWGEIEESTQACFSNVHPATVSRLMAQERMKA